jgi:hypothetical protein
MYRILNNNIEENFNNEEYKKKHKKIVGFSFVAVSMFVAFGIGLFIYFFDRKKKGDLLVLLMTIVFFVLFAIFFSLLMATIYNKL